METIEAQLKQAQDKIERLRFEIIKRDRNHKTIQEDLWKERDYKEEYNKTNRSLVIENNKLKKELTKFQADDILCLIDLSKKLNTKLKSEGESAMVSELMLQRAKVMDHFTLAYLADTGFKPSQIKLVQGMNNQTEMFEMYFEKITTIIL